MVDNKAEKDQIIDDFIKGTTQALVVENKSFCRKRNILLIILGLLIIAAVAVVVHILLKESNYKKLLNTLKTISEEEFLLGEEYSQSQAFNWLLKDKHVNGISKEAILERYISVLFYFLLVVATGQMIMVSLTMSNLCASGIIRT